MELLNSRALLVFFVITSALRSLIDIQYLYYYFSEGRLKDKPEALLTTFLFVILLSGTVALWNKNKVGIYFLLTYSTFFTVIYAGVFLYYFDLITIDRSYQSLFFPVYSFSTGLILSLIFGLVAWTLYKVGTGLEYKIKENYLVATVLIALISSITLVYAA